MWYHRKGEESKVREVGTLEEDFWEPIFKDNDFKDFIKRQYSIGHTAPVDMEEIAEDAVA